MAKSRDDEPDRDPEVEKVVDELMAADKVIERYRERCTEMGHDPEFDPPSLVDRLMLINATTLTRISGTAAGGGLTPDQIMGHLDQLRTRLLQEVEAKVAAMIPNYYSTPPTGLEPIQHEEGKALIAPQLPPEEIASLDTALKKSGMPSSAEINAMSQEERDAMFSYAALETFKVRLNPPDVHAAFEDLLFRKLVDMHAANNTLDLLVGTPEGNKMLQLMVYDSVIIKRKRAAKDKGKKG